VGSGFTPREPLAYTRARMSLRTPADFDPLSPETLSNPYPFYEALRRCAPVYRAPAPTTTA
jgi:hypothetical protein